MKTEKQLLAKIAKNALLSVLIYALPIALMLGWFYINGERPWQQKNNTQLQKIK